MLIRQAGMFAPLLIPYLQINHVLSYRNHNEITVTVFEVKRE